MTVTFFCKADTVNTEHVTSMLNIFEKASKQKANEAKTSIFFRSNTEPILKGEICNLLHFHESNDNCKYLGLPNMTGEEKDSNTGVFKR